MKTLQKSKLLLTLAISALFFYSVSLPAFAATTTIDFSGYTWTVKSGFYAPGPNNWDNSTSSVFLDNSNQLHLKVSSINNKWYSSEVYLPSSLGYGTYEWETPSHVDAIDTNLVLGLFLYQDDTHELDIEFSNWTDPAANILNYSVQPANSGNTYIGPIALQDGISTHKIEWTKDYILFSAWQNGQKLSEWKYIGTDNFIPGEERLHMNFWMINEMAPSAGTDQEVVLSNFKFTPESSSIQTSPPQVSPEENYVPNKNKGNSKGKSTGILSKLQKKTENIENKIHNRENSVLNKLEEILKKYRDL